MSKAGEQPMLDEELKLDELKNMTQAVDHLRKKSASLHAQLLPRYAGSQIVIDPDITFMRNTAHNLREALDAFDAALKRFS